MPDIQIQDIHARNLAKSTTITGFMVNNAIPPSDVIAVLNREGVSFMLVGAYAMVGWTKSSRATEDVDVIVATRHHKKAVKALLAAFPHLVLDEQPAVSRLRVKATREVAIDVMKAYQELLRVALKNTYPVSSEGQSYKIPSLEMALTLKFAAMISPNRSNEKKHIDAHDFIRMVKVNAQIDREKLAELGELVYLGGGLEIVEKVRQVRTGEQLNL